MPFHLKNSLCIDSIHSLSHYNRIRRMNFSTQSKILFHSSKISLQNKTQIRRRFQSLNSFKNIENIKKWEQFPSLYALNTLNAFKSMLNLKRNYVTFVVESGSNQNTNFFEECEKAASRLSFTRIQDYKTCPQKFRFKYIEKQRTPMTEHAIRGSALHEAISVFGKWHSMNQENHSIKTKNNLEEQEEFNDYENETFNYNFKHEEQISSSNDKKIKLSDVPDDKLLSLKVEDIKTLTEVEMKKLMSKVYDIVWKNNMKQISFMGTRDNLIEFYKHGRKMLWKFYARESSMLHKMEDLDHFDVYSTIEYAFDDVYGFDEEAKTLITENTLRRPEMVEKHFSFNIITPKRKIRLTGIFDRIDRAYSLDMKLQNDIIVVEYKTALRDYSKEMHKNQVKLYTYAFEKVHGIRPAKGMLFSISEDDFHIYEPRPRDTKDVEMSIIRISDSIASGYFRAKPDFNKCKFCDFRKICPFSLYQRNPNIKTDIEEYKEEVNQMDTIKFNNLNIKNESSKMNIRNNVSITQKITIEDESDVEDIDTQMEFKRDPILSKVAPIPSKVTKTKINDSWEDEDESDDD